MAEPADQHPTEQPFAYRITNGEGDGATVHTVYEEDGRFVLDHEGVRVVKPLLRELIKSELVLHLIGSDDGTAIESPVLKDYEIAALVQPVGSDAADFTVNGVLWSWSSDVIGRDLCPVISDGPHDEMALWAESHWANVPTEKAFIFGIEGSVYIEKLGPYYFVTDEETGESHELWVEEPDYPWDRLFLDRGVSMVDQWVDAPDLDSLEDEAIASVLELHNDDPRSLCGHVIWINSRLWEWSPENHPRRRTPSITGMDKASISPSALPQFGEMIVGRPWERPPDWERITPVGPAYRADAGGTGRDAERFVVVLQLPEPGQPVDLGAYEQLLEAVFKWPLSDCQGEVPPYALVRSEDDVVAYGCVMDDREGALAVSQAFGSPAVYRLLDDAVELLLPDGSLAGVVPTASARCDRPDDAAFSADILTE